MVGSDGIEKFIRPHLADFTGYSASTSPDTLKGKVEVSLEDIVKMNANENPYGCSPRVLKALAECQHFNIYPDDGQQELRKLLAGYAGVPAECIVAGHGSNTIIDSIVRLFVGPGDEVINSVPTFDIYRFSTEICGGKVVNVNRDDNFAIDVKKIKAAITPKTKLIFLATPNNPTGNVVPQQEIVELIETGLPVVVDEAYYEFSGETVMPVTQSRQNLMVLRSFSKWAGLAGLRVGYGVFPARIAAYMMAIKIPHNVSVAAEIAVRESLTDLAYLQGRVQAIVKERARLFSELQKITWLKPYPSQANFIYCAVSKSSASELHLQLQKKGVLVRYFNNPLLKNSIRVSVGKPEHTDALIKALRSL
ncbi:MAG: histidinol-phosphate transaminase [Chloroflexi bacterium RBG_16_50_11]|nr:MAG: histidinol-phosphate transaminase [Chloroflexi bacterium RBG_16_50_11]